MLTPKIMFVVICRQAFVISLICMCGGRWRRSATQRRRCLERLSSLPFSSLSSLSPLRTKSIIIIVQKSQSYVASASVAGLSYSATEHCLRCFASVVILQQAFTLSSTPCAPPPPPRRDAPRPSKVAPDILPLLLSSDKFTFIRKDVEQLCRVSIKAQIHQVVGGRTYI